MAYWRARAAYWGVLAALPQAELPWWALPLRESPGAYGNHCRWPSCPPIRPERFGHGHNRDISLESPSCFSMPFKESLPTGKGFDPHARTIVPPPVAVCKHLSEGFFRQARKPLFCPSRMLPPFGLLVSNRANPVGTRWRTAATTFRSRGFRARTPLSVGRDQLGRYCSLLYSPRRTESCAAREKILQPHQKWEDRRKDGAAVAGRQPRPLLAMYVQQTSCSRRRVPSSNHGCFWIQSRPYWSNSGANPEICRWQRFVATAIAMK